MHHLALCPSWHGGAGPISAGRQSQDTRASARMHGTMGIMPVSCMPLVLGMACAACGPFDELFWTGPSEVLRSAPRLSPPHACDAEEWGIPLPQYPSVSLLDWRTGLGNARRPTARFPSCSSPCSPFFCYFFFCFFTFILACVCMHVVLFPFSVKW